MSQEVFNRVDNENSRPFKAYERIDYEVLMRFDDITQVIALTQRIAVLRGMVKSNQQLRKIINEELSTIMRTLKELIEENNSGCLFGDSFSSQQNYSRRVFLTRNRNAFCEKKRKAENLEISLAIELATATNHLEMLGYPKDPK